MIYHGTVTIGTNPTFIGPLSVVPIQLHLHNNDNTDTVYLGGSSVTTSNGLRLLKQDTFEIVLAPEDKIYAIATKAEHVVSYFAVTM
jgi:hypothetical protein